MQQLSLQILAQPNDTTCGPTCLHAVYAYYGRTIDLAAVIDEVVDLPEGGTLAVWLGKHALAQGFRVTIQTCNLQLFDPSWFRDGVDLEERLRLQAEHKADSRLREATRAHLEFLEAGGQLRFGHLKPETIYANHRRGVPLITGLSATYLYDEPREEFNKPNDIEGHPSGHFVVLAGSDPEQDRVLIADPLKDEPGNRDHYYWVEADRLSAAILLGVLTYDASVLVIEPAL
jgi:hypothetical protein